MNNNKKFLLFITAVAIMVAGCSNNQQDLPEIVKVERVIRHHIVKEGESVGSIAEKHSMTRAELIKLNKLKPPYQLYNGQRLRVNVSDDRALSTQADQDIVVTENKTEVEEVKTHEVNVNSNDESVETIETIDDVKEDPIAKPAVESEVSSEYVWPITNGKDKITQQFTKSKNGGVTIETSAGTPVKAIADGVVKIAGSLGGDASSYGKTVIILHDKTNTLSVCSHLQEYSVKAKQRVKKGDAIGKVGKSGNATSSQLFLQIFKVNKANKTRIAIDPEKILP